MLEGIENLFGNLSEKMDRNFQNLRRNMEVNFRNSKEKIEAVEYHVASLEVKLDYVLKKVENLREELKRDDNYYLGDKI